METIFISLLDQNVKIITNKTVSNPYKYTFFDSFTNEQGHEAQNLAARIIVPKENKSKENEPLAFTALGNDDYFLYFYSVMGQEQVDYLSGQGLDVQISKDKINWFDIDSDEGIDLRAFKGGETIYIKGNNQNGFRVVSTDDNIHFAFSTEHSYNDESISCSGNVMSLISPTATEIPCSDCFANLFWDCSSLVTAPELPATTLADSCYKNMFNGCTSLTTAPELPATTLTEGCYDNMFNGCTSLSSVTCLAESGINENDSTEDWLNNVSSEGVFIKSANADWPSGGNGIPNGWTEQTAS